MDHLIESLDVGLGHYGSENKVNQVGAIAVGLKPNPTGVISGVLEQNSLLMCQTKGAIIKGKGLIVSRVRTPNSAHS